LPKRTSNPLLIAHRQGDAVVHGQFFTTTTDCPSDYDTIGASRRDRASTESAAPNDISGQIGLIAQGSSPAP
jgi:hypothetical protein